jgi:hypothetical protein
MPDCPSFCNSPFLLGNNPTFEPNLICIDDVDPSCLLDRSLVAYLRTSPRHVSDPRGCPGDGQSQLKDILGRLAYPSLRLTIPPSRIFKALGESGYHVNGKSGDIFRNYVIPEARKHHYPTVIVTHWTRLARDDNGSVEEVRKLVRAYPDITFLTVNKLTGPWIPYGTGRPKTIKREHQLIARKYHDGVMGLSDRYVAGMLYHHTGLTFTARQARHLRTTPLEPE